MSLDLQLVKYYFDISATTRAVDTVGSYLSNMTQVRNEALQKAADFASDVSCLEEPGAIVVTARNADGLTILTVSLVCTVAVLAGI
ncbi:DUF6894 family protein [Methylobacterium haplocladii]|uniref:DUF6894 domain-containing protein n=1 Tax=Methylobacterium haplocladii TaxID=1176176 RepID=A0A512IMM4_9HYPH|nr:hypothetical protein [Methylobacterium haplocladii]GEO98935.1 hypothetical protein MHA02_13230 [Methylobacterium haplocladii]GLS58075.1 hypothetical protein GCM10007887_07310 [Methylobacterium haplocladii]